MKNNIKVIAVIITKLLANSTTQNISKVNYVDFEQEPNTLKSLLNSKLLMDTYLSTNNWFHVIEFSETFYYKHYAIQFIDTQVDTNGNIPQIRDLEFYGLYNTSLNSGFNKLNSIIKTNDVLFPNKLEYNNENLDSIIVTEQVKNIKVFNYDVDGNDHFYDNTMLSGMGENNYRYGKKDIFKVFNNLIDNSTPNYIIRNEVWTYSNTLNNFINDMRSVHIELDFIESKRIEYMTIIAYNRKIDNIRLFLDTSYSFVKKEIQLNFTYDQKNISITSVKEYISKLNALGLKSRIFENDSNTLSQCYLTIIKLNHQFRDMKKLNFFITDLIEEENNNQPLALSNIELFERKINCSSSLENSDPGDAFDKNIQNSNGWKSKKLYTNNTGEIGNDYKYLGLKPFKEINLTSQQSIDLKMLTTTVEETFQNVDGYNIEFWLYMNKLNELADEESISILRIVNNNSDSTSSIRFEVIVKKTTDNSGNKVYI